MSAGRGHSLADTATRQRPHVDQPASQLVQFIGGDDGGNGNCGGAGGNCGGGIEGGDGGAEGPKARSGAVTPPQTGGSTLQPTEGAAKLPEETTKPLKIRTDGAKRPG